MPVKAKYIKDLPLKRVLDGSESLLVQDLNGTQQAPLGTIVDEIKQNSQEKIREIESELAQTNAQLSEKASEQDLAIERARIDSFTKLGEGSTTGDAELIDARIDIYGNTHINAGNSIRSQINGVYASLSDYFDYSEKKTISKILDMQIGVVVNPNSQVTTSTTRAYCITTLNKGDIVGFVDNNLYSTYSIILGKRNSSSWIGSWNNSDLNVEESSEYSVLIKANEQVITGDMLSLINQNFGVLNNAKCAVNKEFVTQSDLNNLESDLKDLTLESVDEVIKNKFNTVSNSEYKVSKLDFEIGLIEPAKPELNSDLTQYYSAVVTLKKGDVVGFINDEYYNKYKYNIGIVGTSWIGYQTSNMTIDVAGDYVIAVARRVSGVDMNYSLIQDNFGKITLNDDYKISIEEDDLSDYLKNKINSRSSDDNPLYGKRIGGLGDSLMYGHTLGTDKTWLAKVAKRNNMIAFNYGINGNPLSVTEDCMAIRYEQMEDDLDYIVVIGGANDNAKGHSIGENTDQTIDTFKGALNVLIKGLLNKYPTSKILFMTNYQRYSGDQKFVDAMLEICAIYSIPCFDNFRNSGINFNNGAFLAQREVFDLKNSDGSFTKHFTEAGYDFLTTKYEALLKSL